VKKSEHGKLFLPLWGVSSPVLRTNRTTWNCSSDWQKLNYFLITGELQSTQHVVKHERLLHCYHIFEISVVILLDYEDIANGRLAPQEIQGILIKLDARDSQWPVKELTRHLLFAVLHMSSKWHRFRSQIYLFLWHPYPI